MYFVIFNDAISISMGSNQLLFCWIEQYSLLCWIYLWGLKNLYFLGLFFLYRKMMRKVDFQDFFKTCICRYVRDLSTDFPFMQKNYRSDNLPFYCKRHKNWILPDKCAGLGSHTCIYFTQCTKLLKRLRILCSKKLLYKLCNQRHKLHVFVMYMYVILFLHTYKYLHTIRFYKKKVSKF